jgi:hypothetical protein
LGETIGSRRDVWREAAGRVVAGVKGMRIHMMLKVVFLAEVLIFDEIAMRRSCPLT